MQESDGKPVAVIFNPYCTGDRMEEIQDLLYGKGIQS